jgi:uncharacterized protein YjbI with pentapeptide repeats
VDQQQQSRWRPTRRQFLWAGGIAALAFLSIVICGYLFGWKWTGLPKRTLWDWLDLLIIPAVLAVGGYLFTRSENRATRAAAEQRAQDEALQAYLGQMGQMLLDKERPLRQSQEGDEERTLARAWTLTVLTRLDADRKGSVVRFLHESGLIAKDRPILDVHEIDLSEANLIWANLSEANLSGAILREANLSVANLSGAILSEANLSEADLSGAILSGTHLIWTNLREANLREANLSGAILREANLSGVLGVTNEELEQQARTLSGTTMPDGQKYEDWLKSKGHGEDKENGGPL